MIVSVRHTFWKHTCIDCQHNTNLIFSQTFHTLVYNHSFKIFSMVTINNLAINILNPTVSMTCVWIQTIQLPVTVKIWDIFNSNSHLSLDYYKACQGDSLIEHFTQYSEIIIIGKDIQTHLLLLCPR